MLSKIFANTIYVQIRKDTFRLKSIETKREYEVVATTPFTTDRLLVGQFNTAEKLLTEAIRRLRSGNLFQASPIVVIHPMELVGSELSEVEQRLFTELAAGAGARKVFVHVGAPLTDPEVLSICRGK